MGCPFKNLEEHRDPDAEPEDFIKLEGGRSPLPVKGGPTSKEGAAARKSRVSFPREKTREAFGTVGVPAKLTAAFGVPMPKHRGFGKGLVTLPRAAADALATMRAARGFVPAGIGATTESFAATGIQSISAMAETAAAQAQGESNAGAMAAVLGVAGLSSIPLVREGVAQLRRVQQARAGVLGKPGGPGAGYANPFRTGALDPVSPQRVSGQRPRATPKMRPKGGGKAPARSSAGGGRHINYSAIMKGMTDRARRYVAQQPKRIDL